MQLRDIALKNLQRRKSKMLFLVFGMVFGIATIVALFTLTGAMEKSISKKIEETGIKLAVTPDSDTVTFSVGGIPVASGISYDAKELPSDAVQLIKSGSIGDKIRVVAPKVMGTTMVNGTRVLAVGIDFPGEFAIKSWWEMLGGMRPDNDREVLAGYKAARKLDLVVGQPVELNGRAFTVSGILAETGEEEDGIIFLSLAAAREILGKQDNFSFIELTTVRDEKIASALSAEIAQKIPGARVKIIKEAAEARQELVGRFEKFSLVVSLIMILIASLIITTTMMSSVNERTREIGIFRAIGFRRGHITRIILTEAGLVSGVSAAAGYLMGMGAAVLIAPLFSTFEMEVTWNPLFGIAVLTGAILLGLLSGLYPALRAAKLDPAEALRFI
ncbi:MAG: ABC transporter permease [Firmicutes bacterium HGW-Firmicutes-14]|nr:MAG: ABC transporter permease [Firmicutes bacterium HGW-Firmicutes-14]